jgi:hypothetical protein
LQTLTACYLYCGGAGYRATVGPRARSGCRPRRPLAGPAASNSCWARQAGRPAYPHAPCAGRRPQPARRARWAMRRQRPAGGTRAGWACSPFLFTVFILFLFQFRLDISSSLYFRSWILVYVNYCCLSLFSHVTLLSLDLSCDAYVQMCFYHLCTSQFRY